MSTFQGDGNILKLEFTKLTKNYCTRDFIMYIIPQ